MKIKAFIDLLKSEGVTVKNGTNHYKLYYGTKWTICPRHPSKEISDINANNVIKQLVLRIK